MKFCSLFLAVIGTASAATVSTRLDTREIVVRVGDFSGKLRNLQGTLSGDSSLSEPGTTDIMFDRDPQLGNLFPEYAIKHVLIYLFPNVFLGWGKNGTAGDGLRNENYNWTGADEYMRYVTSNGAKASIQFQPVKEENPLFSPELFGKISFMITDRYMNGAYKSGISNAIEIFEFYPETDLLNRPDMDAHYKQMFSAFAAFSRGVAAANKNAGVAGWGGNRFYQPVNNYTVDDPFNTRFFRDCKKQNVLVKAATFHFLNTMFSFDPYDIKVITDTYRQRILVPAGLPDLPIWATHAGLLGSFTPTSQGALQTYNDPAFISSFLVATVMYAQDTSIDQVIPYPGFGYGAIGGGNAPFPGFFNKSASGPVPLNVARAYLLQAQLIKQTPTRVKVKGTSADGFTVLAGRSDDGDKVQVFLNNYQFNYNISTEIAARLAPAMNTSTTAYPLVQQNRLLNGEAACFATGNSVIFLPVCLNFVQPKVRDNKSQAYRLRIQDLPWKKNDRYRIQVQRVFTPGSTEIYLNQEGKGQEVDVTLPFPPNAQDLVTVNRIG